MNNTIESSALRTQQWLLSIQSIFLDTHPQANTLSDINITREDIDAIKTISQNSSEAPDEFKAILLNQCSKSLAHGLQLQ